MAKLLYRLGRTAYRRWPAFLVAWIVVLVGLGVVGTGFSKPMSNTFSIPGIESVEAAEKQQELFPDAAAVDAPTATVVVAAEKGAKLADEPYAGKVAALVAELNGLDVLREGIAGPVEAAAGLEQQAAEGVDAQVAAAEKAGQEVDREQALAAAKQALAGVTPLSEDGRVGTISITFAEESTLEVTPAMQDEVLEVLDSARDGGLTVEVSGSAMQQTEPGGASSELIGIGLAIVILGVTFGSLVAAGMPIITALIGVGIGVSGISAMTIFAEVPSSTTALASMLGLAVGIDYALFVLSRFRSELDHTDDREEAIGIAVGTAGSAVVFAGLTVIIALVALGVVGISFLTAMGIGAAVTVLVAVLVALTLLPAILGMLKTKAFGGTFRRYRPKRDAEGHLVNMGAGWARTVGKAPLVWALLVVIVLGALAIPVKNMRLALPTDATAPVETTARKASDLVADAFGPGRLSPLLLVVDGREVGDPQAQQKAFNDVVAWASADENVATAMLAGSSDKGAMVLVQPRTGGEDEATEKLLERLRDGESEIEEATGTDVGVTGMTAIQVDVSEMLADALPVYLAIVIGLAFVLLVMVFRSILVPLTATLGFLLSVMATLGATVLIFQEGTFGWFSGQPIVSFIPICLIGVVFGLAMDYQVCLVTRIREAHVHGMEARAAVVDGFRNSARVVTAAALIMTSVFAGFIFMDNQIIQSMGFALAAAVIFDAFLVRMVLIPALMYLLGEKAWWLPKWLDRIIPDVDVEGAALEREHPVAAARARADEGALEDAGV